MLGHRAQVKKQLPTESKRFLSVDKTMRRTMAQARASSGVFEFCNSEKFLMKLGEGITFLETVRGRRAAAPAARGAVRTARVQVQNGLSEFLETKRVMMSRFYFITDAELLHVCLGRVQCANEALTRPSADPF